MSQSNADMIWEGGDDPRSESGVDYHRQWQAFKLRRNVALFFLYGWVPVCGGLFELSRQWIHRPVTCLLGMAAWLVCAVAAVWWAGEFRCPRCRRRYGALGHRKGTTNLTRGMFDQVCSNCKLTKFEIVR
jgi:hypothetical protein